MSTRFDIKQGILLFYSFFTRDARFIRASVVNQPCEDVGSVAKRSICSACGGYKKHNRLTMTRTKTRSSKRRVTPCSDASPSPSKEEEK
jgi:hypothetical protein